MFMTVPSPGLGIVPLLIAAGLIGSGVWLKLREVEDYEIWKESVPDPTRPPAPPAPQTRAELESPALWAGTMPARTEEQWKEWKPFAQYSPTAPADSDLLLAAGAVGAIALLMLLRS